MRKTNAISFIYSSLGRRPHPSTVTESREDICLERVS